VRVRTEPNRGLIRQTHPESTCATWVRPTSWPDASGSISEPLAQRPARVGSVLCGPVRAGTAHHLKRPWSPADRPSSDRHVRLTSAGFVPLQARPGLTPGFSPQRLPSESRSDHLLRLNQTVNLHSIFCVKNIKEKEDMECDKQTQDWYI
ncbi:unnamed protein product, partial [Musa hybrid cultivar]